MKSRAETMLALAMPRRMSEELKSTQIVATLKACVQNMRNDGFFPVYIRVTHNRTTQYIKTDNMVTKRELSRSKEITDPFVMQFCTALILDYNEYRVNKQVHY